MNPLLFVIGFLMLCCVVSLAVLTLAVERSRRRGEPDRARRDEEHPDGV